MVTPATTSSPFHSGEQVVQERLGVREIIEPWARKVIRSWLPDQHREFYRQLPFVVAAARDGQDRPWVTLLTGTPGFIESPDPGTLVFNGRVLPGDALEQSLGAGAELGLLGVELETRRRNRVNGTLVETGTGYLRFDVGQAFGNCPQYITERTWHPVDVSPADASAARHTELDRAMQDRIRQADTFFIGSGCNDAANSESNGMDASHRGGPAGFVKVGSPTRIVFPDYAGNNHFNTIGNLVVDPRVALLFVNFETGGLLQITGHASIDWDSSAVAEHSGAQRLVIIDIEEIVELADVLPLRFSEPKGLVRELRLIDRRRESDDVVSFYFASRDGGALPDFEAGQHLPLEVGIAGQDQPVARTYSLSNGPGQGHYRISVKRESRGLVSRYLHDAVDAGSVLKSRSPAGDFVVGHHDRPIVLLSAGIGVTPMISMLHELTERPSERPILFLHGARNGQHHALAGEVNMIAGKNDNVTVRVAYSQPLPDDVQGRDFDIAGRIDSNVIRDSVTDLDAEFFLCGPAPFLTAMADLLSDVGISDEHIHVEQF
jgi:ferredoxin-NADP reductase/predicted pyridoxine 5'-phosphate oxidase superfamily flavin-nucleotide-binding protein